MKNLFRIIILIILAVIISFTLYRNKRSIEIESNNAKQGFAKIPVHTFKLKKDIPVQIIKAAGTVNADHESYIVSTQAGEITEVNVKLGDFVEKGFEIARVNDFYARKEYDIAKDAYDQLKKDYDRYQNLAQTEAVTGQQMEQLKLQLQGAQTKMSTLKQRLDETHVKSTLAGYINQVFIKKGGMLGQGSPVCEIVDPKDLSVMTNLPEPDIFSVHEGTPAKILLQFGTGEQYAATVRNKGVKPDHSGKYPVSLTLGKYDKDLLPGTLVDIAFYVTYDSCLLIPSSSLVEYRDQSGVFIRQNEYAIFKPVIVDKTFDDMVSLKRGLEENMEIITDGSNMVTDSSRVVVVER